jgi:hypothetical protein
MRRAMSVVALMVLPISILSVGIASTAAAATPSVTCSKLSGNILSTTNTNVTFSKCTDTANTDGSGTLPLGPLIAGSTTGTITWKNKGTTNIKNIAFTQVTVDACPTGDNEYMITATIAASTGKAKSLKKGWTMQATVCLNNTTGALSLLAGTKVDIGAGF